MSKYFLIAGTLATIAGAFANKGDLQAAAKTDADAIVITNPNDIYEALSESQIRRLRADVQARIDAAEAPDGAIDADTAGQRLFQNDTRFNVKGKKMAQAQKLYDELRAWVGNPVFKDGRTSEPGAGGDTVEPVGPKAPRAPRRNIKGHIRGLFPEVGATATYDQLAAADPADPTALYSNVSITTALSDLRSEKYAGEGGPVNVKRVKAEDGSLSYVREA